MLSYTTKRYFAWKLQKHPGMKNKKKKPLEKTIKAQKIHPPQKKKKFKKKKKQK